MNLVPILFSIAAATILYFFLFFSRRVILLRNRIKISIRIEANNHFYEMKKFPELVEINKEEDLIPIEDLLKKGIFTGWTEKSHLVDKKLWNKLKGVRFKVLK